MSDTPKPWGKLVFYGLGSAACYVSLFANARAVMAFVTRAAVAYCLAHPRWGLSLQTHKYLAIP